MCAAIPGMIFLGAAAPSATAVVFIADPLVGILAVVNLVVILMLFLVAMRAVDDFRRQLKGGGVARPVFDPDGFADLDRDAWLTDQWK